MGALPVDNMVMLIPWLNSMLEGVYYRGYLRTSWVQVVLLVVNLLIILNVWVKEGAHGVEKLKSAMS